MDLLELLSGDLPVMHLDPPYWFSETIKFCAYWPWKVTQKRISHPHLLLPSPQTLQETPTGSMHWNSRVKSFHSYYYSNAYTYSLSGHIPTQFLTPQIQFQQIQKSRNSVKSSPISHNSIRKKVHNEYVSIHLKFWPLWIHFLSCILDLWMVAYMCTHMLADTGMCKLA